MFIDLFSIMHFKVGKSIFKVSLISTRYNQLFIDLFSIMPFKAGKSIFVDHTRLLREVASSNGSHYYLLP